MGPRMIINRYTNVVLTVIALALSVIAIENLVRPSRAQKSSIQLVAVCDMDGRNCLDVERDIRGSFIKVQPK
jgi:hypothetical protein